MENIKSQHLDRNPKILNLKLRLPPQQNDLQDAPLNPNPQTAGVPGFRSFRRDPIRTPQKEDLNLGKPPHFRFRVQVKFRVWGVPDFWKPPHISAGHRPESSVSFRNQAG